MTLKKQRSKKSTVSLKQVAAMQQLANELLVQRKSNGIKLNQLRLEQLNNELERRLHQYEYLVAQEKAILGSYNINLFANESVNNFHLFARLDQKDLI